MEMKKVKKNCLKIASHRLLFALRKYDTKQDLVWNVSDKYM